MIHATLKIAFLAVALGAWGSSSTSSPSSTSGRGTESRPAGSSSSKAFELPGSKFSLEEAMKDLPQNVYIMAWHHPTTRQGEGKQGFVFAGVCVAVSEPVSSTMAISNNHTIQEYKLVKLLAGEAPKSESFSLYYVYQRFSERGIPKQDQVIWMVHRGDMGELLGVKVIPDTEANREAITKLAKAPK